MAWINLPKTGPDSWQGFRVALKCMCIITLTAVNMRASGVIYVAIMNHFGVSREEAAWPVSLAGAMLCLIGMVTGPLAQAFSPKPVILCGSLLIVIGLMTSVFAPNIMWLSVTYGLIFGSGLGAVFQINVIFLQQYFVKMRGLALGLNYSGSTAAGFVFPIFIAFLLGEYGFSGAILILSGVSMNIFVLCLTHKEAPWLQANADGRKVGGGVPSEALGEGPELTPRGNGSRGILEEPGKGPLPSSVSVGPAKEEVPAEKVSLVASLSILKIPEFYAIMFSFTLYYYAHDAYITTIIDFIVDQNIPFAEATTIIPLYSITDMVARLVIPQFGDRGYINKMLLQCVAYCLQCVCFSLLPIAAATGDFFWIAALAMVESTGVGTSIVMYGVLMAETVGVSRLPMASGVVGFFVGLTYVTKPFFVGYFRDTIGHYSQMYRVCSVMTGLASLCWLITWFLHRDSQRKRATSGVSKTPGEETLTCPRSETESVNDDSANIVRKCPADGSVSRL